MKIFLWHVSIVIQLCLSITGTAKAAIPLHSEAQPLSSSTRKINNDAGFFIGSPTFNNGGAVTMNVCRNSPVTAINNLLSISDNASESITWSIVKAPSNGTLSGFNYATVAGIGTTIPVGLGFKPVASFYGSDNFIISVTNGTATSQITVNVICNPPPATPVFTIFQTRVSKGQMAVPYSVSADPYGSSYNWIYIGGGVTINNNTTSNNMNMDFGNDATSGTLYVQITGPCGNSRYQPLDITVVEGLPVTWVSFNVIKNENTAILKWSTAAEYNSDRFEVEYSTDAAHYSTIGSVKAKGYSSSLSEYSFVHQRPAAGNNYYRLKQIDKDGKFSYSSVKVVAFGNDAGRSISVFPNPVQSGTVQFLLSNTPAGNYSLLLYDMNGQLLLKKTIQYNASGIISLALPSLSRGSYAVQISNSDLTMHTTLIKE